MANISVYGLFATSREMELAAESLRTHGFRAADISILVSYNEGSKDFCTQNTTKAPEGASVGASAGVILGSALGWLAGIGALAIPGAGLIVAAGPVMALLAGAGAGSMVGGVTGALVGLGMPEYEAKRYAGRVETGGSLLSVHCDDKEWEQRAREILADSGANDISSSVEAQADFDETEKPHQRSGFLTE